MLQMCQPYPLCLRLHSCVVRSVLCHTQSQYAPLTAIDSDGEGSTAETLVAWGARAAEDRQLTVRDVWGLMLHSVRGASLGA